MAGERRGQEGARDCQTAMTGGIKYCNEHMFERRKKSNTDAECTEVADGKHAAPRSVRLARAGGQFGVLEKTTASACHQTTGDIFISP